VEPVISINTLAYEGYDLNTALTEISGIGARYVELGFTKGYTEGLTEAYFSEAFARETGRRITDLGLSCFALSAHTDLSTENSTDEMKRRIDFGKRLGVGIVHTKVGPRSRQSQFYKNIVPIADYARSMDMIIGLENPAEGADQIIESGKTGAAVVKEIGSDWVRLNYDFGNAFTYSRGKINPAVDYREALPHACHLHFKDFKKSASGWDFAQIGRGVVGYGIILNELIEENKLLPLSIEHLFIYCATRDLVVQRKAKAPELSHISMSLKGSLDFVKSFVHKGVSR
jgi:sugar phosphate isomerase/epimerase